MISESGFESRTGRLNCRPEIFYAFITDLRNFKRFVPAGSAEKWQADAESCSFEVPPFGPAGLKIAGKVPFREVNYKGEALQKTGFSLKVLISEDHGISTSVKLLFEADLNPVMRMMAAKPVEQFLEKLVAEMEKFNEWEK